MNQEIKLYQSVVTGIGASLPKKIVTNKDLTKIVDTTEEWIVERTGIQERRIASDNETTSSLGTLRQQKLPYRMQNLKIKIST
tara:strand:- start:23 stop:271 length:249 start_codon:yes stop_codon:yes gene_type:complete